MRSSRVVRASDRQFRSRNSPGFDPSILRHSGILGAADEGVLNIIITFPLLPYSPFPRPPPFFPFPLDLRIPFPHTLSLLSYSIIPMPLSLLPYTVKKG